MVSSSEKAMKYISSNNFEAEFALKLYRSDKENLTNELTHLTLDDLLEAQKGNQHLPNSNEYHSLVDENNRLKKDIMVLEKEFENIQKQWNH